MTQKIAVIGGGISGLAAAYFSSLKGHEVTLFEGADRLGGLAASFDFNGITIEKYYHFICGGDRKLIETSQRLGIEHKLVFRPTITANFLNDRFYKLSTPLDLLKFSPISLVSRIKFGLNFLDCRLKKQWEDLDGIAAEAWLIKKIGREGYEMIWRPLLKEKFGQSYKDISAAWIWHRIHRVSTSRRRLFSKEKMGYFHGGTQTLIDAFKKAITSRGGTIHTKSHVRGLIKKERTYIPIIDSYSGGGFDALVLAVPFPVASRLIRDIDAEYASRLSAIKYIGVICGLFRIKKRVSPAFWLNINDPRIATNGLIEYTNLNPLDKIDPEKIVYIPIYTPVEDAWYHKTEAEFHHEFKDTLRLLNPELTADQIVDHRVFRSPYAQAVCTTGFKDIIPPVKAPSENIFTIDAVHLYPSDRALSALIKLAEDTVEEHF